jgi:hypothetical protein
MSNIYAGSILRIVITLSDDGGEPLPPLNTTNVRGRWARLGKMGVELEPVEVNDIDNTVTFDLAPEHTARADTYEVQAWVESAAGPLGFTRREVVVERSVRVP